MVKILHQQYQYLTKIYCRLYQGRVAGALHEAVSTQETCQ